MNFDIREFINKNFRISPANIDLVEKCEKNISHVFDRFKAVAAINQYKIIEAFKNNNMSVRHFNPTTGYGYSDEGRDKLCDVFADVFKCEKALVSPMFMSGTHTISVAFFGMLRPGDTFLCITGKPYDTFNEVIYGESGFGSLKEWGVNAKEVPLLNDEIDIEKCVQVLKEDKSIKLCHIQRSRGYDTRASLSCKQIKDAVERIKAVNNDIIIFVDNCYGEFTEFEEPTQVGADVMAGSLIKNPGGGFAPTGGYIAGREDLIEKISHRFTAPGVGSEIGSYAQSYLPFFQGLFMAPHIVCQALMGVALIAEVMKGKGYEIFPDSGDERYDITQSVVFHSEEKMTAFIRGIQKAGLIKGLNQ